MLQQMLKMLPFLPNAPNIAMDHGVANSLEFFPENCLNLVAEVEKHVLVMSIHNGRLLNA
jgi:hypothetical protein